MPDATVAAAVSEGATFDFLPQPVSGGDLDTSFHGVSGEQLHALAGDIAMGITVAGLLSAGIGRMWRFAWNLPEPR